MGIHYGKSDFINYGKPSLLLDFARNKSLVDRISGNNLITFARASTGTYVGADGLIKYAGADEARFDHDPATGESLGLLIEESRTNIYKNSDFSAGTTNWFVGSFDNNNYIYGTENTVLPTGQTGLAWYVEQTGNTTFAHWHQSNNVTYPTNSTIVFSIWGKGSGSIRLITQSGYSFVSSNSGDVGGTPNSSTFPLSNQWQRFWVVYNTTSSVGYPFFASETQTAGVRCYYWGGQVEQGSSITSLIKTPSNSGATRSADTAQIIGTNFSSWYNQSEGTIFSQHSLMDGVDNNNNCYVYQVDNGTNNEVAFRLIDKNTFYSNPSKLTATTLISASSVTLLQKSSVSSDTTLHSTSYAVKTDDFAVTFDGATVQTDNSGSLPNNQTTLSIGYNAPANTAQLNGHIKKLIYYPTRLTNAQLQSLTS